MGVATMKRIPATVVGPVHSTIARMSSVEPLARLVDDCLSYLYEARPTAAALDGVHTFDDLVEDLRRPALEAHARELGRFLRRLEAIAPETLSAEERLDRDVLEANLRARVHEIEVQRFWELNPQYYADVLATSLATQAIFPYAPLGERARRVLSKLRQAPRLVEAARENVKDPPGIFVKIGLETFRGLAAFVNDDLLRAFADVDDPHLLADLADAATEAAAALGAYIRYLEEELAPRSRGSFRLGRERLETKLRLEEGFDVPLDRLLRRGLEELAREQERFRRVAGELDSSDPVEAWRRAKAHHPAPGELVSVVARQLDELAAFLAERRLVSMPPGTEVVVAPTPPFYRWTFASMWTPGPFEPKPVRAHYYITDADPTWPPERQEEHLRDFNFGTLWSVSIHEVFPGHFLHYQRLRRVASALRKSILFAPASFVEGWAHYCEQMMIEEGFAAGDPLVRLGQLAESLVRLARLIVGIRLHAEDWSVEQAVRFFREEAFVEEATARREAERGAFDPGYVVYAAGKLMLLKLREDCRRRPGFSLREFHDRLLDNGSVPFWVQRRLLVGPDDDGALL